MFENPVLYNDPEYQPVILVLEAVFHGTNIVREILAREDLFIQKTPEEIVFGYVDPVLKLLNDRVPILITSPIFALRVSS